jgi:predicted DNA-binding transcriptional regulator YafY
MRPEPDRLSAILIRVDSDPTHRALTLLSLLQSRRQWTASELADRLGIGLRTLRRDVMRLRGVGYAVDSRPGPGSTYRLVPGASIPPLLFTPDEVTALVAGLGLLRVRSDDDAVVTARVKLEQVLPDTLRRRAAATELATEVLDDDVPAIDAIGIGTVADAVADDAWIRFDYVATDGRASTRLVHPYRHALSAGRWYLIGYDIDRGDWRTFRFDRVTCIERTPGTHRRPDFPDTSVARWFARDFGRSAPS